MLGRQGIYAQSDGVRWEVLERSGSVSDLAAGQIGVVVQDGDVVDGEVHCLRRHRYRLAHVFKQASAKEGKR